MGPGRHEAFSVSQPHSRAPQGLPGLLRPYWPKQEGKAAQIPQNRHGALALQLCITGVPREGPVCRWASGQAFH